MRTTALLLLIVCAGFSAGAQISLPQSDSTSLTTQPGNHEPMSWRTKRKAYLDTILQRKNVVSLDAFELANGGIGLCYMREFDHGRFSVTVPLSVGFARPGLNNMTVDTKDDNEGSWFTYDRKIFEAGIGANRHFGHRPVAYFVGVLASIARYQGRFQEYSVYGNPGSEHTFNLQYFYLRLNNGVLFRINRHVNLSLNLAFGFYGATYTGDSPKYYYYEISVYNNLKAGLFLGYRF